ncbi:hypothetical protein SUGI_1184080 [Cryptomeria japonica]|uniref:probable disease resistance protein At4g33300 n=1 Tax=Cryptomeria japonica TaxID=3369 RepID=UPI0024149767|nr:probable disease resistance protein At4g33300 [Cryptomeria japonica]GLJ55171.1 hypothetical protein SUGI_1184080 [Cryptomeria japonica]
MLSLAIGSFAGAVATNILSCGEDLVSEWWSWIQPSSSCASLHIPKLPKNGVGLDSHVRELKKLLFEMGYNKVGVSAMGGSGKTTLVAALCRDAEVKEHFGDKIFFQTVSEFPDNKTIIKSIWKMAIGDQAVSDSQNIQEALQERLRHKQEKILVILDDVGPDVNLEELLFEAEGCKIVVTARGTINFNYLDSTYNLPLLGEEDALSLFCYCAFGQKSIPDEGYDKQLVKEVVKGCGGLPLALVVIGRYLHKQSENVYWEHAKMHLSQGGRINNAYEDEVLNRLALSIENLDNDTKECFLDLILFPEVKKIPVDALFDIWIHKHNLSLIEARKILLDLEDRRLLSLVQLNHNPGDRLGINSGSASEIYVVQHDVLLSLAIYWANKNQNDKICKRLRLYPLEKHSRGNKEVAEIIAIRTGSMKESQWPKVEFPKARALVLIFDGNEYFLPPFLEKMPELEVLIIINQNSCRTKLDGMSTFSSLVQLKSLRLEKLIAPLQDYFQYLKNLRKLSLSLWTTAKRRFDIEVCSKLLEEVNISYCEDIKELRICNLTSLKTLSITNCHQLHKIPKNLGNLAGSLQVLRLVACLALKELPASIYELGKLEVLDISKCQCLHALPADFDKLQRLKTLNMGDCKNIKKLPRMANGLKSLSLVVCDEQLKEQWSGVPGSIEVIIEKQTFDLDWLLDE